MIEHNGQEDGNGNGHDAKDGCCWTANRIQGWGLIDETCRVT